MENFGAAAPTAVEQKWEPQAAEPTVIERKFEPKKKSNTAMIAAIRNTSSISASLSRAIRLSVLSEVFAMDARHAKRNRRIEAEIGRQAKNRPPRNAPLA